MDSDPAAHTPDPSPAGEAPPPRSTDLQRLWTPWRMRYVGGGAAEPGCIFCRRLAENDDVRSLILHRGRRAFAIMNLYPYNTGHLMLVPNQHVASPEDADPAALTEIAALLPPTLRALRRVLNCDGFNLGTNVGAVAGAGVADHLHQHLVPRWEGDANFMPILASTMVLPELIPVTYAKIRVDLAAELSGNPQVTCVALADDDRVLATTRDGDWRLPVATAAPGEALWAAARRAVSDLTGSPAEIVAWAGPSRADRPALAPALALAVLAADPVPADPSARWLPIEQGLVDPGDAAAVAAARANVTADDGS